MKHLIPALTCAILAFSSTAFSAEPVAMDKVKTGLLSATQTYTIYQVSCSNETVTAVAAMDRATRWCVANDAQLDCFRDRENAAIKACSATLLATSD